MNPSSDLLYPLNCAFEVTYDYFLIWNLKFPYKIDLSSKYNGVKMVVILTKNKLYGSLSV